MVEQSPYTRLVLGSSPSACTCKNSQCMNDNFSKNLIKEYKYWSVYIHENQSYLGRLIIWCKREHASDLSEATKEEQQELFLIVRDLREATLKLFSTDWFNYAFLGNETKHLH